MSAMRLAPLAWLLLSFPPAGAAEGDRPAAPAGGPLPALLRVLADRESPRERKMLEIDRFVREERPGGRLPDAEEMYYASPPTDGVIDRRYRSWLRMLEWTRRNKKTAADYVSHLKARTPPDREAAADLCTFEPGLVTPLAVLARDFLNSLREDVDAFRLSFAVDVLSDGRRRSGVPELIRLMADAPEADDRKAGHDCVKAWCLRPHDFPPFEPTAPAERRSAQIAEWRAWWKAVGDEEDRAMRSLPNASRRATEFVHRVLGKMLYEDTMATVEKQCLGNMEQNYDEFRAGGYRKLLELVSNPKDVPPFEPNAEPAVRAKQFAVVKAWWDKAKPEQERFFAKKRADFLALREELKVIAELESAKPGAPEEKKR